LIQRILSTGFTPQASRDEMPKRSWMPVRWAALVPLVLVWNILFILNDRSYPGKVEFGPLVMLALAIMFCAAFGVRYSPRVQSWFMKPGRSEGEIRPIVNLMMVVTGAFLLFITTVLSHKIW